MDKIRELKKKIHSLPFWIRLAMYAVTSIILGLHLRWCQKQFLHYCSIEDCPALPSFRFNANRWKYPYRAYMESLQRMHLELYIRTWTFLIPECHTEIDEAATKLRHYFEEITQVQVEAERNLTNWEVDHIPMEQEERVTV